MDDPEGSNTQTQADTQQMTSAAVEAGQTAEQLDQMLRNLMDNLSPLADAWVGVAGTSFQNVRIKVEENMRTLHRALTSIAEDLNVSSTAYEMTDDEIAQDMTAAGNFDDSQITRLLDGDTNEVSQAVESGASPSEISEKMNTA